ncbi:MAG: YeeE/YedE family protein [Bdellovibrionota bacterium]
MIFRPEWINALCGGALIGFAASLLLLFNGRVMGISGILSRALSPAERPNAWRWNILAGLLLGGFALRLLKPEAISNTLIYSNLTLAIAGLLVGFGTVLGNGCTSGHGVCGVSRLSFRSILATCVFILAGILSVAVVRRLGIQS